MPKFKHDCDECVYVGSFTQHGVNYDGYFCPDAPAITARYGDGNECKRGLGDVGFDDAITEVYKLAREKGLVPDRMHNLIMAGLQDGSQPEPPFDLASELQALVNELRLEPERVGGLNAYLLRELKELVRLAEEKGERP